MSVIDIKTRTERKPQTVPLGVFREMRDELKATKVMNKELVSDNERLRERLKMLSAWLVVNRLISVSEASIVYDS